MLNENILKNDEKAVYSLRSLYRRFGYSRFKMSKFEEYDLYVRNKDFLISDGIITFTDTNGRLLALKPDVTLSIIKNAPDVKGHIEKLYYNENVYRISKDSHSFREITQTGLECIGDIGIYDICEVLYLAVKSLESIDENYIVDIAHAGLVSALINACNLSENVKASVLESIQNKSIDEITFLFQKGNITQAAYDIISKLISTYKSRAEVFDAFNGTDESVQKELNEFLSICSAAEELELMGKLRIDFSIVNNTSYYSGLVFKGYISGIPTSVLSGGQYDKLMKKMGKRSGAVGFAVYLDALERHGNAQLDYDYDFVILKDTSCPSAQIIRTVESLSANGFSVIVLNELDSSIRYKTLMKLTKNGLEGA
ncbi:MAG: ATP phosphoribosyltransferase regulatory subunit [Clostridia bacterium]|nr:ATP phosphoribosyltransferase regulatory subunit [Clostridia bacterium]